jgi:hypothetical protein
MALKQPLPFKEILTVVRGLTPAQKERIIIELEGDVKQISSKNSHLTELLLKGPVFTKRQIKKIEENRKSISAWRTKK